jgi:hypothetical protein
MSDDDSVRPDCVSSDNVPQNEKTFDDRYSVSESVYYMRAIKHREGMILYYTEQLRRATKYTQWKGEIPSITRYLEGTVKELGEYWMVYAKAVAKET